MELIADAGSTKTDWVLLDGQNIVERVTTQGINPVHHKEDYIFGIVTEELNCQKVTVNHIRFYGAGCSGQWNSIVQNVLARVFPQASTIKVDSDLMAAARALFGERAGIACILGTGSNSCMFDGDRIVDNVPPLGYILGDEGSGAVLGKLFLNALFKRALPASVCDEFFAWSGLSYADVIEKVYRQPLANRFLSSCSLFIYNHLDDKSLFDLVRLNFKDFFLKNVIPYERKDLEVGAVGSIAWYYQDILRDVAAEMGLKVGVIMKSPLEGLVGFHSNRQV